MPVQLYPHQQRAISQLKNGSVLVGGVGSGKSRTALAYYFSKECGGGLDPFKPMLHPKDLYIITTARKRDTLEWEGELSYFLLSTDPKKNRAKDAKVTIDSWNNIHKYKEVQNAFFIFDEQRVVGTGAWVKSFLKIAKSNHWILLSATPGDTWSDYIPVFIANGFYKNFTEFRHRHIVYNRYLKYPKPERYLECGRLLKLRREILVPMPFHKDTLPRHEDILVPYDMELTKTVMRDRWNPYTNEPITEAGALCYILRRIANENAGRLDAVADLCREHPRAIIFYNFDYELELLRMLPNRLNYTKNSDGEYEAVGEPYILAEWNGHKHEPVPDSNRWIYLVQYTAGAEGWNCTTTDTTIFYSQNYSYKIMTQAAGRIDRLNTPFKDLYFYHLRSSAPIDIAIHRALKAKKNFNERSFAAS